MNKTARYAKIASSITILAAAFFSLPFPASAGNCVCADGTVTSSECTDASQCGTACMNSRPATCGGSLSGTQPSGSSQTGQTLQNPISVCGGAVGQKCVQLIIGNVIRAALGIVGSIALLMMIWGGFLWLTSMGNGEKVEKGKSTLIWATLGLVVIFGAYAITNFLITAIASGK